MPRGPGKTKKDPFADLDDDFKASTLSMAEDDVRKRASKVAFDQQTLMDAKLADGDFIEAKERFAAAGAIYRDGTKLNRLKIRFCKKVLEDRGKAV